MALIGLLPLSQREPILVKQRMLYVNGFRDLWGLNRRYNRVTRYIESSWTIVRQTSAICRNHYAFTLDLYENYLATAVMFFVFPIRWP